MQDLEPTTRAIIDADAAHLGAVSEDLLWERRGLLRTLARTEDKAAGWWRRALRLN
ncbi:MAG TPA: hypothetical protein VGJ34_08770 [Gaiellaceae bacterium]|jgi:hypothetical protein